MKQGRFTVRCNVKSYNISNVGMVLFLLLCLVTSDVVYGSVLDDYFAITSLLLY